MLLLLHHQRPDGEVDTYHLKPGRKYHIGRGSACEVRILDLGLSRKHCALEFTEGRWKLIDMMSTNGCKLDGDMVVGSQPVKDGATIMAGNTTLVTSLGKSSTSSDNDTAQNVEQEPLPEGGHETIQAPDHCVANRDWEPQPASTKVPSGVLQPHDLHVPYASITAAVDQATDERRYVISVLGQRVGPLTRNEARDLKAREQTGQLSLADLERYPRPS